MCVLDIMEITIHPYRFALCKLLCQLLDILHLLHCAMLYCCFSLLMFRLCQLRVMSQYIPSWLEATIDRDELSKPLPQDDLRRFRNIRATKTSDTFSVFYDPLVE